MAKKQEKITAKHYYVVEGKTAKECAKLVNVTEKTLGNWVENYGWKAERAASIFSAEARINNIKSIISNTAEQHIELNSQLDVAIKDKDKELIETIRAQMAKLSDEASKWNKALENLDKSSKISLSTRITILKEIFDEFMKFDEKLFMKTIDFQEHYLHKISSEY